MALIRFVFAFFICLVALLLPYSLRIVWFRVISNFVHLPFKAFGKLAGLIMKLSKTENPYHDKK